MKRSKHNLSHTKLLSCDMGELVPISCVEVLPGDSIMHATSLLLRAQPLLAPVMHPVDVRIHHWYVPWRLVWDEFEDFITGGPTGTSLPAWPWFNFNWATGQLGDYLGVPGGADVVQSALYVRAYQTIFNEWYRDQDLQSEVVVSKAGGHDATTSKSLQRVNWEKDYFTSARPWEQKGPAITLPLGTTAPVNRTSAAPPWTVWIGNTQNRAAVTTDLFAGATATPYLANAGVTEVYSLDPAGGLVTDLSSASAITVRALRQALALQRFEEARARYGSRYTEYLRYLGVTSSDARLQRPEYLGGGRQTISFSEVLQTAPSATTGQVGTMRGHGIAAMRSNRYRRFFEEHGCIMTLLSVRPKTMYMQGLPRKYNRQAKEDYWQKELEHIGQQSIKNKEVYVAAAAPDGTFGWQDRYDEYRREENTVAGEFRNILNFWHLAREFASEPALNSTFVSCNPTERVFPVPSEDVLYIHARHNMVARRLVAPVGSSFTF